MPHGPWTSGGRSSVIVSPSWPPGHPDPGHCPWGRGDERGGRVRSPHFIAAMDFLKPPVLIMEISRVDSQNTHKRKAKSSYPALQWFTGTPKTAQGMEKQKAAKGRSKKPCLSSTLHGAWYVVSSQQMVVIIIITVAVIYMCTHTCIHVYIGIWVRFLSWLYMEPTWIERTQEEAMKLLVDICRGR